MNTIYFVFIKKTRLCDPGHVLCDLAETSDALGDPQNPEAGGNQKLFWAQTLGFNMNKTTR